VEVVPIYWGAAWVSGANALLATQLDQFFDFILASSYVDLLAEYSETSTAIGHGRRVRSVRLSTSEPGTPSTGGRQVTDAQIQTALQGWIAGKTVPATTSNTLYFIYLPPGVVSVLSDGTQSCAQFCGYHSSFGGINYAVVPFVTCPGCNFDTNNFLDTLTEISSHELAEAITDPALNAWYDSDLEHEIGDICNRQTQRLGGYLIQTEWSNKQGACVLAPSDGGIGTRISLWRVDDQGNQINFKEHGPFRFGWMPLNCADNNILFRNDNGTISFWVVDDAGNQLSFEEHGPFVAWTAVNYSGGRILFSNPDGRISLWKVDGSGNQLNFKEHGPFIGWYPVNCDGNHVLWRNADGRISFWVVDDEGNQVSFKEHGPFDGWTALNYSRGTILWAHASGQISIWKVDNQGNLLNSAGHGPFDGWTPLNASANHVLWRNDDGMISFWQIDDKGNLLGSKAYGPFQGWTALNYSDGRILWLQ
jgi:hypothetical protein